MSKNTHGSDTRLGDEIGRELHHRADEIHGAPLSFDDVRNRAGRIQRNRRLASVAAVAAAVAVIVPVGIFAGQGLNRSATVDPASPGPSRSASPTPGVRIDPGPHQLNVDAPSGPKAAVPYLDGSTLVWPDGTTLDLPKAYGAFQLVGDQLIGLDFADGTVDVVDRNGKVVDTHNEVTALVGNESGAVWSTQLGEIVSYVGGVHTVVADPGGEVTVKAVVGDVRTSDYAVYFNRGYGETPMVTVGGKPARPITDQAIAVDDADADGRTALWTSERDGGVCSGVHDPSTDSTLWETCDHAVTRFSPDGRYLLARPPYGDGLGDGSMTVLDARTGDVVTAYKIDGGFISSSIWEDGTHLLTTTHTDEGWRMLRLGFDGSIELVAGPVADADEMDAPFHFQGRP